MLLAANPVAIPDVLPTWLYYALFSVAFIGAGLSHFGRKLALRQKARRRLEYEEILREERRKRHPKR